MKRSSIMKEVKAVIFDMDGLMFATEKIYYRANQKTADHLGMEYSFETYSQFIGIDYEIEKAKMREFYTDHQLLEEFFLKSNEVLEYLFLHGEIDLKKGLLELLDYLQREKIPAVVASSTERRLVDQLLKRLNVLDYFEAVVGGDEVAQAKPDPAIFNKAFGKIGIENKKETLILEDSKNGVLAAADAGIPVIMVPDLVAADAEVEEKTLAILPDLKEVIDFIEEINK